MAALQQGDKWVNGYDVEYAGEDADSAGDEFDYGGFAIGGWYLGSCAYCTIQFYKKTLNYWINDPAHVRWYHLWVACNNRAIWVYGLSGDDQSDGHHRQ